MPRRRPRETFWTYVVTALEGVVPGLAAGALAVLEGPDPSVSGALTLVLNALAALPDGLDLVLDDYHLVDGPDLAADVAFLLLHLPPRVRLVVGAPRRPAPCRSPGLRARGELVEVRAADLRFTAAEAAAYLVDVAGLPSTAADVAALEDRTEGWVAALQLAALSLRGRDDVAAFIAGFAGDDRYVVDYLVEEVLQPPAGGGARDFLLRDLGPRPAHRPAVRRRHRLRPSGRAVLEAMERANLFVVPLDDRRHWYRYHHLFADVLRAHLGQTGPTGVAGLHRRAAHWYAAHDEPAEAVRHAAGRAATSTSPPTSSSGR